MHPNALDLSGQRFGLLVVLARIDRGTARVWWRCRCDCGTGTMRRTADLRAGMTTSCGCTRNAMTRTRIAVARCRFREYLGEAVD